MQSTLSKATMGRLPMYLQFIRRMDAEKVSATQIAKGLGLGEVQVRKELPGIDPAPGYGKGAGGGCAGARGDRGRGQAGNGPDGL